MLNRENELDMKILNRNLNENFVLQDQSRASRLVIVRRPLAACLLR